MQQKIIMRPAFITAGILLVPLIAMQFTEEVQWTLSDFVIMGTMLFVASLLIELALQKMGKYRFIAAAGVLLLFLWLWVELAVGLFTTWGS